MTKAQEKSRYTKDELQEFDAIIVDKLARAQEQLSFYLEQMEDISQGSDGKVKGLDDGSNTYMSERANEMAARQRKHLQHLKNARLRIQNNVYGICRATGKLISKDPLKAVPHATLSTLFTVLVLDQWLKIWVKTNLTFGEEIKILGLDWARLHFVENEGMAFGLKFGGDTGKLILSVFRIGAVALLGYLLTKLVKQKEPLGLIFFFTLILAGAIGNILDSMFYGLFFSASSYATVAEFLPEGGGYTSFLFGHVVDMFYFPLFETILPEWLPWRGGTRFQFFRPVFNGADSAITIGVIGILVFYGSFLGTKKKENVRDTQDPIPAASKTTRD